MRSYGSTIGREESLAGEAAPVLNKYTLEPIDILYGSAALRETLDRGGRVPELTSRWPADIAPFLERRQKYLLY